MTNSTHTITATSTPENVATFSRRSGWSGISGSARSSARDARWVISRWAWNRSLRLCMTVSRPGPG